MKLSNKILIGFFGCIFLYLTAAFTEIRLRGNPNVMHLSNSLAETADITGVSYLILPDLGRSINVIGSDNPRLEVRSLSGDLLQKLKYNVSGDTLTLTKFDLDEKARIRITIYVPVDSFKGMTVNGADVAIENLDQAVLSVVQVGGRINVMNANKLDKLHLESSNNSHFYVWDIHLNTIYVELDNAEVQIKSPVKLLEGSMTNNSYLGMTGTNELRFKKDGNSKLYLY